MVSEEEQADTRNATAATAEGASASFAMRPYLFSLSSLWALRTPDLDPLDLPGPVQPWSHNLNLTSLFDNALKHQLKQINGLTGAYWPKEGNGR
jgi:hypothetical protein